MTMSAESQREQIAGLVANGLQGLEWLLSTIQKTRGPSPELTTVENHLARFKLWVGTLGAHHASGTRSLEYRLRDASTLRKHVASLLRELKDLLIREGQYAAFAP